MIHASTAHAAASVIRNFQQSLFSMLLGKQRFWFRQIIYQMARGRLSTVIVDLHNKDIEELRRNGYKVKQVPYHWSVRGPRFLVSWRDIHEQGKEKDQAEVQRRLSEEG